MIRNQWYAVLESKQLRKKNQVIGVIRMGEKLVFWRDEQSKAHCLYDKCIHRGVELSKGKVINNHIQCPFHGLEYDGHGKCTIIPANGKNTPVPERFKVNAYHVEEIHDFIWIWWGKDQDSYPEIPWFPDVDEGFHFYTLYDHWNTHYSRVIENQLDVVHLPFVHHNTIGRGNATLVNGPLVKIEDNKETLWVFNQKDDGSIPKNPEEIPEPNRHANLTFKFPHVWENYIHEKMRIIIAFIPIDDNNTLAYIRYYQKIVKIPGLKQLMSWFGKISSRIIAHQDRRVVETQDPKRSDTNIGEMLIQGDRPIVIYRKKRRELIEQALSQER